MAKIEWLQGISVVKSFNLTGRGDRALAEALEYNRKSNTDIEGFYVPYTIAQKAVLQLGTFVLILESIDFSGKEIYPFCTHAGSGLAGTVSKIQNKCTDAEVKDGLAVLGTTVQNDKETAKGNVLEWLNKHGNTQSSETPAGTAQPAGYPVFDLADRTITLNNGIKMPVLGIGTYQLSSAQAENSVYWALRDGYRLIDTARIYGNEDHIQENFEIFDFELSEGEMEKLKALDRKKGFPTIKNKEHKKMKWLVPIIY